MKFSEKKKILKDDEVLDSNFKFWRSSLGPTFKFWERPGVQMFQL